MAEVQHHQHIPQTWCSALPADCQISNRTLQRCCAAVAAAAAPAAQPLLNAAAACPALLCEQQLPAGVRCCMYTAPAAAVAALLACVAQVVSSHTLSSLGYVHQRRMTARLLCLRHICLCTCQLITQRCKFPVNTLESVLPAALHFTIHSPAQSCRQACSLSLYHQSAAVSTACMLLLLYCQHNSIKL